MKVEKIFYGVKCDGCGRMLPNEWEGELYDDSDSVDVTARESGWLVSDDGHHYCEECVSLNDDDCWETKDGKLFSYFGEAMEEGTK